MNKKIIRYLTFIGLFSLMLSCEKDETQVVLPNDPILPTIQTMPNLTLTRETAANIVEFVGTPVDLGFVASATYFLEVCLAGNNFADALVLYSGVQDTSIKFTVSELNEKLLKKFTEDQTTSVDFRIRTVLVVDAGTGAPGTSANPFVYSSTATNANISIYGLPRLDLVGSGITQKIVSPMGNGQYLGFVKLNTANPFTLHDPDANITYGNSGGALAVDGTAISVPSTPGNGWYKLTADVNALTFSLNEYMIGLVGSATPNGWGSPDQKMDYDAQSGTWYITADLVVGEVKFRKNDGWAWNLGGTVDNLTQGGANIPISSAGSYTIRLTIINDATGTCTIVKN